MWGESASELLKGKMGSGSVFILVPFKCIPMSSMTEDTACSVPIPFLGSSLELGLS